MLLKYPGAIAPLPSLQNQYDVIHMAYVCVKKRERKEVLINRLGRLDIRNDCTCKNQKENELTGI